MERKKVKEKKGEKNIIIIIIAPMIVQTIKTVYIYAITDEHLHMHCTGLAPAPAPEHAPAHANSTLNTHTHRSALSQRLVVRYHERQKAICHHDKE